MSLYHRFESLLFSRVLKRLRGHQAVVLPRTAPSARSSCGALGKPVFTTFERRLGAVDEALMREGRLRRLEDAAQVDVAKGPENSSLRVRRDPRELVKLLLSASL